mmetsp:Transcript_15528/g.42357  ORF Transcript_15528/g.42357 Transcript_15528/m.42357 type:complete len:205 (-) Transcript_15528:73-687(-)
MVSSTELKSTQRSHRSAATKFQAGGEILSPRVFTSAPRHLATASRHVAASLGIEPAASRTPRTRLTIADGITKSTSVFRRARWSQSHFTLLFARDDPRRYKDRRRHLARRSTPSSSCVTRSTIEPRYSAACAPRVSVNINASSVASSSTPDDKVEDWVSYPVAKKLRVNRLAASPTKSSSAPSVNNAMKPGRHPIPSGDVPSRR